MMKYGFTRESLQLYCQREGIQSFIEIDLGDFVSFSVKPVTVINSTHKWKIEYK